MEVSKTLQAIARLLNLCGATLEDAFVICATIQDAGKEEELLDWLLEQEDPPKVNRVLEEAVTLAGLAEGID